MNEVNLCPSSFASICFPRVRAQGAERQTDTTTVGRRRDVEPPGANRWQTDGRPEEPFWGTRDTRAAGLLPAASKIRDERGKESCLPRLSRFSRTSSGTKTRSLFGAHCEIAMEQLGGNWGYP